MSRTGGQDRRRALIQAAVAAFGARGYEGTTLDAVAEAAGVRKQSLLYYFPTKEQLFEACVGELTQRLSETLAHALEGRESGWARMEGIIRSLFRLAEEWPEFPGFIREASRRGPETVGRIAATLDPLRKRALQFLEREMDAGELRRQEPTLVLFLVYTAVVGSLTEAGVLRALTGRSGGKAALRRREEELLAFLRSALQP